MGISLAYVNGDRDEMKKTKVKRQLLEIGYAWQLACTCCSNYVTCNLFILFESQFIPRNW